MRYTFAVLVALVAVPPVLVKAECGNVDEAATCRKICEFKLPGKRIYHSEIVGVAGDDGHRTCACYPERYVVVFDPDEPPRPAKPEEESK